MPRRKPFSEASVDLTPSELSAFVARVVVRCLDVRSVWVMENAAAGSTPAGRELLLFADHATLHHLRRCDDLHDAGVEMLVVVDGDAFESVWPQDRASGSLARRAWRQVSAELAYYDESAWAGRQGDHGAVVRVRRKATLMWQTNRDASV